jgi:hypothetical protein
MKTLCTNLMLGALLLVSGPALAQDETPGECSQGLCGTPDQSGGGCGCGCGCSILVAMTDRGDTYQFADDFDGDGIEDEFDVCPFASDWAQADADGDGVGDACDSCANVMNALQENLDGDAQGDACDSDDDNDTISDASDLCPRVPDAGQLDFDTDGTGDACDLDDDDDGVADVSDNCRLGQPGGSTPCDDDPDGDGIDSGPDNCDTIANAEIDLETGLQIDTDGDGVGDDCDLDKDNDGIDNWRDNCSEVPNPSQVDMDHDGIGDNGTWGSGLAESCDGQECYMVPGLASCLDPNGSFQIRLAPAVTPTEFTTGSEIVLNMFSNRLNQIHSWTATFKKLPEDSDATLENARGSATTDEQGGPQLLQCAREDGTGCIETNDLRFTPDEPGTYEVQTTVTVNGGTDPASLGPAIFTATATVEVGGESAGGCAAGAGSGLGALALGLLALSGKRRKK